MAEDETNERGRSAGGRALIALTRSFVAERRLDTSCSFTLAFQRVLIGAPVG